MIPSALLAALTLGLGDAPAPTLPPAATFTAAGEAAIQDLIILGENRPVWLRVRALIGDRAFRTTWLDAVRATHARLDHDHDGKLTVEEAEANGLAQLIPPSSNPATNNNPAARIKNEFDANPKDGVITLDELTSALGGPAAALRVQADGVTDRRTDALFDQVDRDKDGQITRPELEAVSGTLRQLDRNANELIAADEVLAAAGTVPTISAVNLGRPAPRDPGVPSVVGLAAGESPLRLIRLLFKKYDTRSSKGAAKPDSRLSIEELAIPQVAFAIADASGDGLLTTEELRKYLATNPVDAVLDVALAPEATGDPVALVRASDGSVPVGFSIRSLAPNLVELEVDQLRVDVEIDDGLAAVESTRRMFRQQFEAADTTQDGYLEKAEVMGEDAQGSPLANLFSTLDADGDGKIYPQDLDSYVGRQAAEARGRLTLSASNEGRALFGILDRDGDRQLGAREVLNTYSRILTCDRDHDGRITPEEIPHHIHLTLTRGEFSAQSPVAVGNAVVLVANQRINVLPPALRPTAGPAWFRRMDRNQDGDVSRREFLGTIPQFDRLDRDGDGLVGADEADAVTPAIKGPGG